MWLLSMAQCIYLTEYVDELTTEAIQYWMKDDDDKPTLQPHKPSLASAYIHPNKDHVPLFSHHKKIDVFTSNILVMAEGEATTFG